MNMDAIEIVADDRERSSELLEWLSANDNILVRLERLTLGDYLVDDQFLVERKTISDLIVSIKDGRLFSQACRLANSELLTMLLLEGSQMDLANSKMRREAIQGALINVSLYFGIPIMRSADAEESARLILYAAKQGRAIARCALPRRGRRAKGKRAVQSRILQGLPLVGPERAKRLLDHFGSVEQVVSTKRDRLCEVEGIGKSIADLMRWSVEETGSEYGVRHHPRIFS